MILVVGLGNPGPRYQRTRHNVGFMVVDRLSAEVGSPGWVSRFGGLTQEAALPSGEPLVLLKPGTFMNRSGESVLQAAAHYQLLTGEAELAERLLVVHDELDLPFGALKLKRGGGDAGHRGVRSIAEVLSRRDFMRLRLGIGRPPPNFEGAISDYVLEAVPPAEESELETQLERSVRVVMQVATHGFEGGSQLTHLS